MGNANSACVDGIERRGRVYYMRIRVPKRYAEVEPRREINRSLKTCDQTEARARFAVAIKALKADWEARLAREEDGSTTNAFSGAISLLEAWDMRYVPMQELVHGSITDLVTRIEKVVNSGVQSALVPAALGVLDYPKIKVSEMPAIVEELKAADIASKNANQLREWRNKYINAAKVFSEVCMDKPVCDITEADAMRFCKYWKARRDGGEVTTNHVNKRIRFMGQIVDAYYWKFDIPKSHRKNPFIGQAIEKIAFDDRTNDGKKLALPVVWVSRLVRGEMLEGLNDEARDITIIAADSGTRQSEIYNLPESDIHLDHPIPHILLQTVRDGEQKRQIKNTASFRPVVLLGASLEAMRRHPRGFPRYRGKGSYSGAVNKYFRENNYFPNPPEGLLLPGGLEAKFSIGSTRHTFEDRMRFAKLTNEERAYLMGHSIGKVRGRPVYGSTPDLRLRALYQEMVSFPTDTWEPRPIEALRKEIDRLAKESGFRV
ncbi:DUF6538 domain-containing protein [Rhodovulum adriaticum]|uniref:DUF6538 domain-containing protein n=1 Tax=Rhodovulum adriaticum TaxID=35804 RepID=A0A4R2P1R9_RHOAD|nr:DUF6538 domain-containing protein [Rhodovulum adriaticum]MBK1634811.1 hypothetical protein [Rhodovulum adriaticum]TCP27615.1 hypothetical protein EV656_101524 [Rhodovulum adriaticum]